MSPETAQQTLAPVGSRRPTLTLATPTPPAPGSSPAATPSLASITLSPASTASLSSSSPSNSATRSFSHSRSLSLSEARPDSTSQPDNEAMSRDVENVVRRHHTLSSSRLVRQERSRVRAALPGLGLSSEDQDFYVPPSPINGPGFADARAAWSDIGHGAAPGGLWAATHTRTPSLTSSIASAASWNAEAELPPGTTPFLPLSTSPASTSSFGSLSQPSSANRSSFVVLRGAKGDAALAERRASVGQILPISPPRPTISPPRPALANRNSLKAFLEADGNFPGQQEDWEKSLQDERDKEELELRRQRDEPRNPYVTPPLPSTATFGPRTSSPSFSHLSQSSRDSPHRQSIASVTRSDEWINGTDDSGPLRRHQSLTFRQDDLPSSDDGHGWPSHDRGASEDVLHTLGSDGLSGFSTARVGGARPPSLSLVGGVSAGTPALLSHSNSLSSHNSHHGSGSLSHSNSMSSHGHSNGGALSPVGGFPRSPWSPTVEETKQLGMGIAVGSPPHAQSKGPSRGGSMSSNSSHKSGVAGLYGDEVARLTDDLTNLDVVRSERETLHKPPTPPGLDIQAAVEASPLRPHARSMTISSTASLNRRLPPLMTNPDVLASLSSSGPSVGMNAQSHSFISRQGPASAAAFVPPIGHSHHIPQTRADAMRGNFTAAPGAGASEWSLQKEMLVGGGGGASSTGLGSTTPFSTAVGVNPLAESWPAGGGFGVGLAMAQQQQIQLLQSQMQQAMQVMDMMKAQGHAIPAGFPSATATPVTRPQGSGFGTQPRAGLTPAVANGGAQADSPVDIPGLIASKGYNPTNFDLRPPNARFFVIKSYTEEDVHKSLKYEIWASTDLGNKRLDRAFRESADKGPIYLFFSVNGSGHFAGMAQMLTPVDYAMSSNVWASDKWKGVLKVRWIYIKDVPLASLRHVRLSNTPENKPVTSSRDTQEVPYTAGLEVMKIICNYQSRTSLLQDFHWYEARTEAEKTSGTSPVPHQPHYSQSSNRPPPPSVDQQQPYQAPPHSQQYAAGRRFGVPPLRGGAY